MKVHTSDFKDKIKLMGRELSSKIIYTLNNEEIELTSEDLNSITPHYESSILKSTMKQLDIDSNVLIPEGTVINYQFGLKVGDSYEYLNYGNYVVYKVEEQKDTHSYTITCYDKMLYSMIPYESMNITYPISIRDYLEAICNKLNLDFANSEDTFANYDKMIQNELYLDSNGNSLDYTFRDVLDELAQVTASTICINEETDELEIRYINDTEDIIDEEYLKDVNVEFSKKYGPINSIVLSRSAGTDNVYLKDEESIMENGLCEIKIKDNQIMNFNDRADYLIDILDKLDGLEYYLNDFSSTGIFYYDLCDRYGVSIENNIYSCIMFNDEVNITQGAEENIYTEMPEESETDYSKADKTDRRINQTYLIVDKQNQEIQALAEKIVDVSTTESGIGQVEFENASFGALGELKIKGTVDIIYPSNERLGSLSIKSGLTKSGMAKSGSHNEYCPAIYPENNLYLKDTYLIIRQQDKEDIRYKLPINYLRKKGIVSDEFVWKYNKMTIIRRIGVDAVGETYILANEYEEDLGEMEIILPEGDGTLIFESFPYSNLTITYMYKNEYTETFATKVETKAEIKITTDEIMSEVSKKVGDDEIISKINQSAEEIQIDANKISLNGKTIEMTSDNITIDSNNFKVTANGNITASGGTIGGFNITDKELNSTHLGNYTYTTNDLTKIRNYMMGTGTLTDEEKELYDIDGNGNVNSADYVKIKKAIDDGNPTMSGIVELSSQNMFSMIKIKDLYNNIKTDIGMYGIKCDTLNCNGFSVSKPFEAHGIQSNDADISVGINQQGFPLINLSYSNGNITCVSLTQTSKEEMKKNIAKFISGLEIVKSTDIYEYNIKDENDEDKKHIGFIIGDNYKYSKKITSKNNDGVDIYSMTSVLWQAVKEQQKIIEGLEKRINLLEKGE